MAPNQEQTANLRRKWHYQKHRTKGRLDRDGKLIEFKLTFEEWLKIWVESDHWWQIGLASDAYVMARLNDLGHYEVGNVVIQTKSKNSQDAWLNSDGTARDRSGDKKAIWTEQRKRDHSIKLTGRVVPKRSDNPKRLKCPHCKRNGGAEIMQSHHFDKCIMKI